MSLWRGIEGNEEVGEEAHLCSDIHALQASIIILLLGL